MELFDANTQWANRPPDERFGTVEEMRAACKAYSERACTAGVPADSLRVESVDNEVVLVGESGKKSRMSHWSFGVLASRAGAPGHYIRTLPSNLAAMCLNEGLNRTRQYYKGKQAELLFHQLEETGQQLQFPCAKTNDPLLLRALTSNKYERIWNWEVVEKLQPLLDQGWRVPPARPAHPNQPGTRRATRADVLDSGEFGLSVREGDPIAPAGLYASDHDMFAFMVFEDARINDGTNEGCSRGFFIENNEVGSGSLKLTRFLYRHVCGNHIVWDASDVIRRRIRHVGRAHDRVKRLFAGLKGFSKASEKNDVTKIKRAQAKKLGKDRPSTTAVAFKKLGGLISLQQLELAFDEVVANESDRIDPTSVWGIVQGITRLSQRSPFADERTQLDRAAGKVLRIAF